VSLRRAGWDVSVISPKGSAYSRGGSVVRGEDAEYEERDGIRIHRYALAQAEGGPTAFVREYATALWHSFRLTRQVWARQRVDVVQVCNPPDFFFPLGWMCRLRGAGFIFDHHDLVPESIAERWHGAKGAVLRRIALLAEWLTLRAAHVVMATNDSYRQVAVQRGGLAADRVIVVRNGPPADRCERVASDATLRHGRRFLVGYLGIMGPQDGLEILAEAIEHVVHSRGRTDIQFLLVGDGPIRPRLLEYFRTRGLEEVVSLPGLAVTLEDWQRYLSAPDVCVSPEPPTPFNEKSTITKVAEYLAMQQPVVAFDLAETRHTARDAAVYVTPATPEALGDAILSLLDDPERRSDLAARGFARAMSELTWKAQEPALFDAYERAADQANR
jgi:glycosyltransferase involved in cell wall biosynthesis